MQMVDISSEEFREYIYENDLTLVIPEPLELFITESGSHRVTTMSGRVYRPSPGFIGLCWAPREGAPAFVA